MGSSVDGVLTRYAAIRSRARDRIGPGDNHQPSVVIGGLSKLRKAMFSATVMRGAAALRKGSSCRPNTLYFWK